MLGIFSGGERETSVKLDDTDLGCWLGPSGLAREFDHSALDSTDGFAQGEDDRGLGHHHDGQVGVLASNGLDTFVSPDLTLELGVVLQ